MTLYGFADADARDLFTTLLGVSGVGPKIALATLAVYDAPTLAAGAWRRGRHRADAGARHRQARRRALGAGVARQDRRDGRGARRGRRAVVTRCAVPWWKPLSDLALRPSRPRRPPTRCWPATRTPPPRAALRAALNLLGKNDMSRLPRIRGARRIRGPRASRRADGRRGRYRRQPAAAIAEVSSSVSRGCASSCSLFSRAPRTAVAHRITSCCPVRRAWARPRWR